MGDEIYGDDTTLLGDFARGFRKFERERRAKLKKDQPYIREQVYEGTRVPEPSLEVPLMC